MPVRDAEAQRKLLEERGKRAEWHRLNELAAAEVIIADREQIARWLEARAKLTRSAKAADALRTAAADLRRFPTSWDE